MGKPSRDKGARRERQWRDQLREAGFNAHRGAGQAGDKAAFQSDVDSPDLPMIHFEVKGRASVSLQAWLDQAEGDAAGKIPVVAVKGDRAPWFVALPADAFLEILRRSDLSPQCLDIAAQQWADANAAHEGRDCSTCSGRSPIRGQHVCPECRGRSQEEVQP